jgi:predicted peptidase
LTQNKTALCVCLALAIAVLAGAGRMEGGAGMQVPVLSKGIHNQTLQRPGAAAIHYAISIPAAAAASAPVPLVLALHFAGDPRGAGQAVLEILVEPALADLGAIIVAPDSLGGDWETPENDRAVNQLLDAVIKSYNIDTKKIAVTGFSMGGRGTWYFAEKYPQRFSAAIPVAGFPPPSAAGWRVPVLAVHSRNDEVAPFEPTVERIQELNKKGINAELITLSGITHFQTYRFVDGLRRAVPWLEEVWK